MQLTHTTLSQNKMEIRRYSAIVQMGHMTTSAMNQLFIINDTRSVYV